MNDTTTDHILTFAQDIANYLRINQEYRQAARNPQRREQLTHTRTTLFLTAEKSNTTLHQHLQNLPEPTFLSRQAAELITRWDHRNRCFTDLQQARNKPHHEAPNEKIIRLTNAERRLVEQLKAVNQIIKKQQ